MGSPQEAEANVPPAYINGAPNFQGGQPPLGVTTYSQPPPSVTSNTTGSSPQPTMSQISQGTPVVPVGAQPQYFQPQNVGTVGSMQQLQNPQQPQHPQPNNFGVMMAPSPTFQPGTVNGQQQQQMQQIQQQSPVYGGQPQSPPATSYSASGQPPLQVVSPLHVLGPGPGAVQCPSCGSRGITNITLENGSTTQ
ncbi:hypothetical protein CC1G_02829 [Coprinopsis cinerea okayama7|uniref:LITAF domain-containing protein n=1 Tax=Coprinopsis cinerea (strain Okayama-7 / 130 / ATCC MYA-4618 / FGSC 9003) TaxID=240176 RepID=A8N060_COPC7|nr:hypothetical protein CC1G_02829 [Coprinopsis cinerea okayama7\|eukprot:XP_001828248.2 hypothetical protein CC1G_02829 [Coprinopsis cinerea okayama7\